MIKATNSSDQSIVITGPDFFFFFLVGDPTKSTAQRLLDMFLYQTARINRVLLQTDRPDAGVGLIGLSTTLVRLFGLDCSVCLLILHDSDGRAIGHTAFQSLVKYRRPHHREREGRIKADCPN